MTRIRVLLLGLVLMLGACSASGSGGSHSVAPTSGGGLSREQAIEAAQRAYPFDGVIDATVDPLDRFDPGQALLAGDHLVWAVVVSGSFQGACGPGPAPDATPRPCPPPAKRATVVVDYFTGEFIVAAFTGGT